MADEKKQRWLEGTYGKAVKKGPERRARFETTSGIPQQPVYAPDDVKPGSRSGSTCPASSHSPAACSRRCIAAASGRCASTPGSGPRRIRTSATTTCSSPGRPASRSRSISPRDGPRLRPPAREGEVGKVGVAIDSIRDMSVLLDGIPLGEVSTSMTINSTAGILLALYQAVGEKQGVAPGDLQGTIQNDILKEYAARGTYIYPPEQSLRLITDIFAYTAKVMPKWNPISISGYHIREAGSTAVQEVAFTLADGIAYVGAAVKAGLDVDAFAGRLSFFFNAHNDLLEEVASSAPRAASGRAS